ncbi:uncharacterized protein G2W53_007668 [Senna tora]|uniref:Uncharacterized protein n=1 Tax=Senna tora TaxID=362788 RepID=A0A835CDX0_9FABA|nr:uncharacterized protein G2W53_007668 [Senna tora]
MVGSQKPSQITRQKTCYASELNTSVRVVFANRSGFMVQLESSWHGRSVDHVLTYSGRKIMVGSQKPSRITRQKTCNASESNTSVRVVLSNQSGFDAPIGVVLTWEECGSCVNIFRIKNRGQISEKFMNYEAKDLLRKNVDQCLTYSGRQIAVGYQKPSRIMRQNTCCASESNTSVCVVFTNRSGFDAPIGVVLAWEVRGSCLNIFRTTNRGRISETFTNYEAKDLLCNESNTLVRVVFANRSGCNAPVGVVLAWEERGSCLNIFWMTYSCRISETFTNYMAKDLLPNESNTSVHIVFANRSGFDASIGVVLAWEERGSCINIFRRINRDRMSETFTNYEEKDLLRKSFDHVLTYFGQQIAVGSQKPTRIIRQKTCCASESNTSVRVVFANRSGFDAPIGVVLAWEERGSCINIFRTINRGRISGSFMNYEAKVLLRKSVDHVLTYSGRQIMFRSLKPSRITRQKTCCASESNTSVRVVFANKSGSDAPIAVDMAWEERGSCLNIFRTINRGRISETFTNYEAKDLLRKNLHELRGKRLVAQVSQTRLFALYLRTGVVLMLQLESSWHGRSMDLVLTYSRRQIAVGSQKPSRITRQKTCCASESNTSVRVVFANRSGVDAPVGVVMALEERRSCLNIFRTTNRGRISETFTIYEAKYLLGNRLGMGGAWVMSEHVPNKKSRSDLKNLHELRGKRLVAQERGSCLNIFRITSRGRISETFANYEAKDSLRKQNTYCASESNTSVRVVFADRKGFDARIGVVLAWEEHGPCLNIFWTINHGRISKTFMNYEAKDLLRK